MMTKPLLHILLWLLFYATGAYTQPLYIPGKVVQGEKAAYRCKAYSKTFVKVSNVENVDTATVTYYVDGTIVPFDEDLGAEAGCSQADLDSTLKAALTAEEWEMIKGKAGYGLSLRVVADSLGNTKELNFVFRRDDPVLSQFSPDRLFQLEQAFKQKIKIKWYKSARRMRNAKYWERIDYRYIE